MPVYYGSTKEGSLYYGGNKIKEAYYGSTKVYSSFVGLNVWEFTNSGVVPLYLVGSYSLSGIPCPTGTGAQVVINLTGTIRAISGILGQSGSSVSINATGSNPPSGSFSYQSTITTFGKKIYQYRTTSFWTFDVYLYEDSVIGDTVLCRCGFGDTTITSLNDNQMVVNGTTTYNKNGSYLKIWTKDGLI